MFPVETPPAPIRASAWTRMYVPGIRSSAVEKVSAITYTSVSGALLWCLEVDRNLCVQVNGNLLDGLLRLLRYLEELVQDLERQAPAHDPVGPATADELV